MARKRNFGWIIWLIILGALGGGGYYGWKQWEKKNAAKSKPQFNTAKIERGDIVQQVTASGTLNPVINVQVGSQISGLIKKLHVDFNSKVKAGDVVAEIDPATYQTRLLQAEADLSSALASLQLAEVNAKRATELFKDKLVSESEYDTAQVALTQAKAQVQTRRAQVNSAKVDLERCTIVAPIDGIVIDRKVDVGQTVAASMNAPLLFMIANDLTKMQINAAVAEADIGNVETNQTVKFTVDAFPGREFVGQVSQVRNSPISVQNVVTYDTIIMVDNYDGKLKPGMTANVQIITSQRPGVIRIPNSALRFKPANAPVAASTPAAGGTNTTAGAAKTGEDIPQTPEAMIAKVKDLQAKGESMSEEMRAQMREMMKSGKITPQQLGFGGGGPGGGGGKGKGGGGNRRPTGDRPATRTIYVVDGSIASTNLVVGDLKPVTIKTGIADSIYTEVIEGLKEGDTIVTGQTITSGTAAAAPQATNPFASGGGFGGGRGPR